MAPIGSTNLETLWSILLLTSRHLIVTGKEAELEAVPKAVANAWNILLMNLNGKVLVNTKYNNGRKINPWIKSPASTVAKYHTKFSNTTAMSSWATNWPATKKQIANGETLRMVILRLLV